MSRHLYTLMHSDGTCEHANVGLVDADGLFLLLLESNKTRHYRFSDESELISEIVKDMRDLDERIDALCIENTVLHEKLGGARAANRYLKKKLKDAGIPFDESEAKNVQFRKKGAEPGQR